jgi:ribonuclease E
MANKMLIDAAHPEETRVVVVRGSRIEEFDFESANRKQLRGNIYLAKVIRVEPSLQAAFVEYGGNRHGFLAFSEIHPDYYQIPVADRQALIDEEERERHSEEAAETRAEEGQDAEPTGEKRPRRGRGRDRSRAKDAPSGDAVSEEIPADADAEAASDTENLDADENAPEFEAIASEPADNDEPAVPEEAVAEAVASETDDRDPAAPSEEGNADSSDTATDAAGDNAPGREPSGDIVEVRDEGKDEIESMGGDDTALEEVPERRQPRRMRQYKIQEVIKRRQVLLVQAVKEERGNKGAALTTYLSLAGRYSVLMPNTARGGGISRKVTNASDRKKMKEIAGDLEVPEGMGVILRTAGANRTKAEVKRDFEYLLRLWETVRETTLQSSAPSLVHEEGSLVKRAIRDLYNKDIEDVQVAGETQFREAKDFMRMLMPSHAKNVKLYREAVPIFTKFGVEAQLDAMFSPTVTLKSGGYIVINQTEALVAIDVNSGRSTRESNIEDTAVRTNLEAAEEVARQLRLRDLAGLIVVDFIDMEENRNNRAVEKKLKDCLNNDRARIQVGRISHFGLLEMSRQRIRTGVLESSSDVCAICAGTGRVRSVPSIALHVLRMIEDNLLRNQGFNLVVRTASAVALYIFNQKRGHLRDIEERFGIQVEFAADDHLAVDEHCVIQRGEPALNPIPVPLVLAPPADEPEDDMADEVEETEEEEAAPARAEPAQPRERAPSPERAAAEGEGENGRRKRRRRRRRGGRGEDREGTAGENGGDENGQEQDLAGEDQSSDENQDETVEQAGEPAATPSETPSDTPVIEEATADSSVAAGTVEAAEGDDAPKSRRRGRRGGRRTRGGAAEDEAATSADGESAAPAEEAPSAEETPSAEPVPAEPELKLEGDAEAPAQPEQTAAEPEAAAPAAAEPEASEEAAPQEPAEEPAPAATETPRKPVPESTPEDPDRPRRSGWWNRLRG